MMASELRLPPYNHLFSPRRDGDGVNKRFKESKEFYKFTKEHADELPVFKTNNLMHMHAKRGSLLDARRVFDGMPTRNMVSWNIMILGYAKQEEGARALELYAQMHQEGFQPNDRTFVAALKACSSLAVMDEVKQVHGILAKTGCLPKGRAIHSQVVKRGFESILFVGNILVSMYGKYGSMEDAWCVFDELPDRDVVTWNTLILGYAEQEEMIFALQLYARMHVEGVQPDARTFIGAFKACSSLAALEEMKQVDGKFRKIGCLMKAWAIHSQAVNGGFESDAFVGTILVDMYAKCGSMEDARRVFDELPHCDVVTWTTMIVGYAEQEECVLALDFYAWMHQEEVQPNDRTFVAALKACSSLTALEEGKQADGKFVKLGCLAKGRAIHSQVVVSGFELDIFVGTTLVKMYAKCGKMEDARCVFDELPHRDVITWTTMILGYAEQEENMLAIKLHARMHQEGVQADARIFASTLKACSSLAALEEGKQLEGKFVKVGCLVKGRAIHMQVVNSGFESDLLLGNTLVSIYVKCGSMEDARSVFDELPCRDVVSWNTMILGCVELEESMLAFELFLQMHQEGVQPNDRTFVAGLKACSMLVRLEEGKQVCGKFAKLGFVEKGRTIHSQVVKSGFELDIFVGTTLVDMYTRCGSVEDAWCIFDKLPHRDVATWNTIILGYAEQEQTVVALDLYSRMYQEGVQPDARTFIGALKACSSLAAMEEGKQVGRKFAKKGCLVNGSTIHSQIVKSGFESNVLIGNTLVSMYSKCGSMEDARGVFEELPQCDVVTWTNMILGYAEQEQSEKAFRLYTGMQVRGLLPSPSTFVAILKACGNAADLKIVKALHFQICRVGFETIATVATSLIDMYAKSGSMVDAEQLFDAMLTRDVVTWNALIAGYARQGDYELVFHMFDRMKQEGLQPNGFTFLSILTVCNHAGLGDKGHEYFQAMGKKFGIIPTLEHYTCMVDILGRAGQMDEAVAMVEKMPFQPDVVLRSTVLGACRKWKNMERLESMPLKTLWD